MTRRLFIRLFEWLEQFGMTIAALSLAAIMVIVFVDATARYLLGRPLGWASDVITLYLMNASIFFAVSSSFKSGTHITIDFATDKMSPRFRRLSSIFCGAAVLPIFVIMFYTSLTESIKAFSENAFVPGHLAWKVWPSYGMIAVGLALLIIRILIHLFDLTYSAYLHQPADNDAPKEEIL